MTGLTTALLSRACRIFFSRAYPEGERAIPAKKRPYFNLAPDQPLEQFLPPAPVAAEVCQVLPGEGGGIRGYAFRLGSVTYPHLKLQVVEYEEGKCVFSVDTHDAFRVGRLAPPPDHPDYAAWTRLQLANRDLKQRIESAWEAEGLMTFKTLLQRDLERPRSSVS
jgi:hypothetical protein